MSTPQALRLIDTQPLQPIIPLPLLPLPILPLRIQNPHHTHRRRQDLTPDIDVMPGLIIRPILRQVGPRRHDSAAVPQRHDEATRDSANARPRRVIQSPGEERGAEREGARRSQEDGEVLDCLLLDGHEDRVPDNRHERAGEDEVAALLKVVTAPGHQDGPAAGDDVGRHGVELRLQGRPAEGVQNGGQEQREALHGDVDEEEADAADQVVDVEDGGLHVVQLDRLLAALLVLAVDALERDETVFGGEESALVRCAGENEHAGRGDKDCE